MQCLNKFLISTTLFSLNNSPNSRNNPPIFQPRITTRKSYHSPEAYDDNDSEIASKKRIPLPPNVKTITSTSNPFVKHCVKLRQSSSYRHFHGLVLVVGTTPIREIYNFHKAWSSRPIIECLFVLDNCRIPEEIDDKAVRVVHVNLEVIRKISGVQSVDSVEVIALVRIPSTFHIVSNNLQEEDCHTFFSFPQRILVLDGIQDPGNLGTLVRSATAFRWDGIFLLPGCCDPFNDKALRACRGACFQIPIVSGNWRHIETLRQEFQLKMFAGHPAMTDDPNPVLRLSKDFADSVADSPLCLVLGSEGAGLSDFSRNACELVTIPMAGEFESLNVSVAGGIFLYMLQHENNKPV
ncbi:UNVERIFIED_CONTAM: putative tRNA/rRNA methyltransferase YsgA [Sesamum radiatum]|uniref:tRNA/rRNA methyltransferase YsgA n=1 Tax=Sesamum radiatum TaxID=300843 RepID=A0AAW2P2U3_SESRA